MENKRFTKNDNGFVCVNCSKEVEPLKYTSRNHCPYCLHSLHVDVMPGDRANECKGKLIPVQTLPDAKKGFIIVFRCEKCGAVVRNKTANDDDMDLIIRLTRNEEF